MIFFHLDQYKKHEASPPPPSTSTVLAFIPGETAERMLALRTLSDAPLLLLLLLISPVLVPLGGLYDPVQDEDATVTLRFEDEYVLKFAPLVIQDFLHPQREGLSRP